MNANNNRKIIGSATTLIDLHMRQCERLVSEFKHFSTKVEIMKSGRPMYWIIIKP